ASSPLLESLIESAFPVYVLHQAAIVIPGYFLIRSSLGIPAKFFSLVLVSAGLTLAVYQWLVRPFAVPRFLLGMKPKACALKPRSIPLSTAAGLLVVLDLALPAGSRAAAPVGPRYAQGGAAQVAIAPCGAALCGEAARLRAPCDDDDRDIGDR